MAYGSVGRLGDAFDTRGHAFANQHRLPFLERSFLVASAAHGNEDYDTAIRIYLGVIDRYPDNVPALNNVAIAYRDSRQYPLAVEYFRRAIQSDSTIANMYFGIHSAQVLQGKFAEARATLDLIARRFPNHPILLTEEIQDAAAQQDWARVERDARAQLAETGADTNRAIDPLEALAGLAMTQGRLDEAERRWRRHFQYSRAARAMGRHLFGVIQYGNLELRYRNDRVRALAFMDSALAALPHEELLPGDRRSDELARFYAAAGERARARQMLRAAVADDSVIGRNLVAERSWTRGVLALAEGRAAEAVRELEIAAKRHVCEICPLPDLGRALEAAGRTREAAEVYRRYLRTPWMFRYEPDAVELGWTIQRLAELQERFGDREAADDLHPPARALEGRGSSAPRPRRRHSRATWRHPRADTRGDESRSVTIPRAACAGASARFPAHLSTVNPTRLLRT